MTSGKSHLHNWTVATLCVWGGLLTTHLDPGSDVHQMLNKYGGGWQYSTDYPATFLPSPT